MNSLERAKLALVATGAMSLAACSGSQPEVQSPSADTAHAVAAATNLLVEILPPYNPVPPNTKDATPLASRASCEVTTGDIFQLTQSVEEDRLAVAQLKAAEEQGKRFPSCTLNNFLCRVEHSKAVAACASEAKRDAMAVINKAVCNAAEVVCNQKQKSTLGLPVVPLQQTAE